MPDSPKPSKQTGTPPDLARALELAYKEKRPHLPSLDSFPAHPKAPPSLPLALAPVKNQPQK